MTARFFSTWVSVISISLLIAFLFYIALVYPDVRQEELMGSSVNMVRITESGFMPSELKIPKGGTIRWINAEYTNHRITGVDFTSPVLSHGQSYAYQFKETGVYEYSDEFNPGIKGRIIVG
ncbi:MAG TPA: hypothetical protein ENN30_01570 [Candidatus Woesearchaeota archaeon]|nr:hypothetical protein [Candidatus Woesearchaeota archaeon]